MKSFSKIAVISTLVAVGFIFSFFLYFLIYLPYKDFQSRADQYRTEYFQRHELMVKKETESIIRLISFEHEQATVRTHTLLAENMKATQTILKSLVGAHGNRPLPTSEIESIVSGITSRNDNQFYFLLDAKTGKLAGYSEAAQQTAGDVRLLQERAVTIHQRKGKGFFSYPYHDHNGRATTVIGYLEPVAGTPWIVGMGCNMDATIGALKKTLLDKIETIRFGPNDQGYFWIFDETDRVVMHPLHKELLHRDLSQYKSLDGVYIFREVTKARESGEFAYSYHWFYPGTEEPGEKQAYVLYYAPWGWLVATGFYLRDLEVVIDKERAALQEKMNGRLLEGGLALVALIILLGLNTWFAIRHTRRLEKDLDEQFNFLEQYKTALDETAYVSKNDANAVITYVNDALCQISGYTKEELIGQNQNIFHGDYVTPDALAALRATIFAGNIWHGTLRNRKKDGGYFDVIVTIMPIKDGDGNVVEYISTRQDITELLEKKEELRRLYHTDTLTGYGNRYKLIDDIREAEGDSTIALLDIDAFKEINDFYGYQIGDDVIREVGRRLREVVGIYDISLYRLHADQFALRCMNHGDIGRYEVAIRTILLQITKEPLMINESAITLSVTSGLAIGQGESLLINADIALKRAKMERKDLLIYDEDFNIAEMYRRNLEWTHKIKRALDDGRFVAYFQPIFNIKQKSIEKFETLVRLIDEDGSVISPFFFLDIAKRAKLYPHITVAMIDQAIATFKGSRFEFSINFTLEDILNDMVCDHFFEEVAANEIGSQVVVELVESEGIENFEEITRFIQRTKELGCKIAIDDFGTGYSNFSYLLNLNADYIKIDGSLIKNLDQQEENFRFVAETVVDFSQKANMKTIAEYVSHQAIADIVGKMGVDYLQGYLIGEPVDKTKLEELLKTHPEGEA